MLPPQSSLHHIVHHIVHHIMHRCRCISKCFLFSRHCITLKSVVTVRFQHSPPSSLHHIVHHIVHYLMHHIMHHIVHHINVVPLTLNVVPDVKWSLGR
jgi:hypothetical protein